MNQYCVYLLAKNDALHAGWPKCDQNEKAAAQVQDIEFIPIQQERYDMVIKKEDFNKPHIQAMLEILNSDIFQYEISGIGGYDIEEMGKITAEI